MTTRVTAVVVLVLAEALVGVGCQKADSIIAEYSSVGTGRSDGGWTLKLYASGKCQVNGPLDSTGTYASNSNGYQLQTVISVRSLSMAIDSAVHGRDTNATTLFSIKTNGTEYLLDPAKYRSFHANGDTNTLRYELRRVR